MKNNHQNWQAFVLPATTAFYIHLAGWWVLISDPGNNVALGFETELTSK